MLSVSTVLTVCERALRLCVRVSQICQTCVITDTQLYDSNHRDSNSSSVICTIREGPEVYKTETYGK